MTLLAINWSEAGVKAGQFILSFSIIVVLHELGHFLPAKWFKCRVEKFYLFFNPYFSLFKKKIGETEYGLGWIPFGGYVKISGMIDESMDKEQLNQPPKSYEFRSKPAWQRLIIMLGGVTVNLFLGFFIYVMMLWYWGETYVPTSKLTYGIATDSLGRSIGLRDGDKITGLDGTYKENFLQIPAYIVIHRVRSIQVEREGRKIDLTVPEDFASKALHLKDIYFILPRRPFTAIDTVIKGKAADKAGLVKNDRVLAINDTAVTPYYNDFIAQIPKYKNSTVSMKILRGTDTLTKQIHVPNEGVIGVGAAGTLPRDTVSYSFLASIPAGLRFSLNTLESYWLQIKLIFSKGVKASESVGSVISISKMFPNQWDWQGFWELTAFFSLVLALMNVLPIPALDGGHAMFTIYEMISGRKPSDRFIEYSQMAGMVLMFGLMAYALGLDIFRLFK